MGPRSPWPIWRTTPAAHFGEGRYWPLLSGLFGVMIFPVVLAVMLMLAYAPFAAPDINNPSPYIETYILSLLFSPVLSWIALPVAVPLSALAARAGFAGWAVAASAGLGAGCIVTLAFASAEPNILAILDWTLILPLCVTIGLCYWFARRLYNSASIGIEPRGTT